MFSTTLHCVAVSMLMSRVCSVANGDSDFLAKYIITMRDYNTECDTVHDLMAQLSDGHRSLAM